MVPVNDNRPPETAFHDKTLERPFSTFFYDRFRRDVTLTRVLVEQDCAVTPGDHVEPVIESRVVGKTDTFLKTDDMPRFTDVVGDSTVIVSARRAQIPHQNLEVI